MQNPQEARPLDESQHQELHPRVLALVGSSDEQMQEVLESPPGKPVATPGYLLAR